MAETVTIGKIKARSSGEYDPLTLRLRLSHLMATAEFHPSGIPPQATLIIKRLAVSQPLDVQGLRVSQEWQGSLRDVMAHSLRSAVRPRNGVVPFDAGVMLFGEQAELIAALSLMVLQSEPAAFWVWQSAVKSSAHPEVEGMFRIWRENPRLLPAVLLHLEEWKQNAAVLAQFSEPMTRHLCLAVLAAFDISISSGELQSLIQFLEQASAANEKQPLSLAGKEPLVQREFIYSDAATMQPLAIPREFFSSSRGSSPSAQLLQIVALLHRSSGSQRQLQQKISALLRTAEEFGQQNALLQRQSIVAESDADLAREPQAQQTNNTPTHERPEETLATFRENTAPIFFQGKKEPKRQEQGKAESNLVEETRDEPQNSPRLWDDLQGIETQYGGVFYLINLLLSSQAFAKVGEHEESAEHLTLWRVLDALARLLLSEAEADFEKDSVWRLLEQWRNREADEQVTYEQEMAALCVLLRGELIARLRMTETELQENIVSLLRVPARVYVSSLHLDVVLPLSRVEMSLRMAGLDASPGWVPEILRVVLFHFE